MSSTENPLRPGQRIIEWSTALGTRAADSGRCCLIEAIRIVGKARYGDEWTGQELNAHHWYDRPKDFDPSSIDRLITRAPPPISLAQRQAGVRPETRREFTEAERESMIRRGQEKAARDLADFDDNLDCVTRLRFAIDWIAQLCRDGKLQSFYRLKAGGVLGDMAPHEWNVDDALTQFAAKGGFDRWFLTSAANQRQWFVYIFVDREGLMSAVSTFAHAPLVIATTDLARLSPYLRFAIQIALQKGWQSAEGASTKEHRKVAIEAAWAAAFPDLPCTGSQVDSLAMLTGFPDRKSIENGLRASAAKKNGRNPKTAGKA